jgi:hypothetical protein
VRTWIRQRCDLVLEVIVLRHQLAVLQRTGTRRPCFRPSDRLLWVLLSRWWPNWQRSLIIVQTATVLRWRRRGLRAIRSSGSCGRWRGGRPRISSVVRALIVRMSRENFLWGAPRIHGELLKLGFNVSQATVSRYMPRRAYPPTQSWRTFLRNQALAIGSPGEAGRISCSTNRTDGRRRYMPVRPRRTAQDSDHWTMAGRRHCPYRSRASPRLRLPTFTKSARSSGCRSQHQHSNCLF